MIGWSAGQIWRIIIVLGLATFAIRFSFLGLIGDRKLPDWMLRHLRYTPVAILPALVTPAILWPEATGGQISATHLLAAAATLGIGYWRKNSAFGIAAGSATFLLLNALI